MKLGRRTWKLLYSQLRSGTLWSRPSPFQRLSPVLQCQSILYPCGHFTAIVWSACSPDNIAFSSHTFLPYDCFPYNYFHASIYCVYNGMSKSWFGVSADPPNSPGRIGGTPKVCSKLKTASDSRGADRRPRSMRGSLLASSVTSSHLVFWSIMVSR